MDNVFAQLHELINRMELIHQQIYENIHGEFNKELDEQCNREADELYNQYHNIIFDNFSAKLIRQVEARVGNDCFITTKFIDVLKKVYERLEKNVIDRYEGYSLIKSKDNSGCETYFIFDQDQDQVEESFDFYDDDSARSRFRKMVDAGYFGF